MHASHEYSSRSVISQQQASRRVQKLANIMIIFLTTFFALKIEQFVVNRQKIDKKPNSIVTAVANDRGVANCRVSRPYNAAIVWVIPLL